MFTKNFLTLILVGGFLVLVVMSAYWFEKNGDAGTEYTAQNNPIAIETAVIWQTLSNTLDTLDIVGIDYSNKPQPFWENYFKNPVERGAEIAGTFKTGYDLEPTRSTMADDLNSSFNETLMSEPELPWLNKSFGFLSDKGFYYLKTDAGLEVGWEKSSGKTYSITIPY